MWLYSELIFCGMFSFPSETLWFDFPLHLCILCLLSQVYHYLRINFYVYDTFSPWWFPVPLQQYKIRLQTSKNYSAHFDFLEETFFHPTKCKQ